MLIAMHKLVLNDPGYLGNRVFVRASVGDIGERHMNLLLVVVRAHPDGKCDSLEIMDDKGDRGGWGQRRVELDWPARSSRGRRRCIEIFDDLSYRILHDHIGVRNRLDKEL